MKKTILIILLVVAVISGGLFGLSKIIPHLIENDPPGYISPELNKACLEKCKLQADPKVDCMDECPSLSLPASMDAKPVIYLYPTKQQKTLVQLDYHGEFIATYPEYDYSIKGWDVMTYPDGKIIHKDMEYSYLFWEGISSYPVDYDLSQGFVVAGDNTVEFLQNKLKEIGLTTKEYNEFIVYWYPRMKDNKYNLIHFAGTQYTDTAELNIIPKPDSMLRVFMVYKPLEEKTNIIPQKFEKFERKGFTVVEWGGSEIK